jgi:hypothetical protein
MREVNDMLEVLIVAWWLFVCIFNLRLAAEYGYTGRMATLLLISTAILGIIIAALR